MLYLLQNCYKVISKSFLLSPCDVTRKEKECMISNKKSKSIMNFKKIVTVIVAGLTLCMILCLPCEAAATTKATTNECQTATNKKKKKYSAQELRYMTSIIYCEARGESYAGQKAVGIVVMNRVRSDEFPNSIKKVIYQSGQFSPVRNGSLDRALELYDKSHAKGKFKGEMKSCKKAAINVLNGSTVIRVNGKKKQMKKYLFFSRYVSNAKYTLGAHQFK